MAPTVRPAQATRPCHDPDDLARPGRPDWRVMRLKLTPPTTPDTPMALSIPDPISECYGQTVTRHPAGGAVGGTCRHADVSGAEFLPRTGEISPVSVFKPPSDSESLQVRAINLVSSDSRDRTSQVAGKRRLSALLWREQGQTGPARPS
jgi:hypothetical protein